MRRSFFSGKNSQNELASDSLSFFKIQIRFIDKDDKIEEKFELKVDVKWQVC